MANPETFAQRIELRAERIGENVNRLVRTAALAIDQALVLGTPVDTGRARSNWQVGLGGPVRAEIPPYSPGSKLGIGESENASAALEQAQQVIAQRQEGQEIWISNNVDYIGMLNEGHSPQAPPQFVQMAIHAGVGAVRGARIVT